MSQLTETLTRWFERLENSRFGSDAVAGLLGLIFFSFTVGIEKLSPRNIGWLTHGDQQTMLLGWWFFASDQWRWPLGANPKLGWEGTNSIVYTDSWPGLALIFKFLDIDVVNRGQFFGLGLLLGSVALFVGARKLFASLEVSLLPSLAATGLLGTTSVFWYMHRWGPAVSAGLSILVWAILFYVDDLRRQAPLWRRWSPLLVASVATNAYLTIVVIPVLGAVVVRRFIKDHQSFGRALLSLPMLGVITVGFMYVLGYSTLPSKWAQTGGYGWYSANVLGLIDSKDASRLLPDIPSIPGQHEPTALGLGTLLLAAALLANRLRSKKSFGFRNSVKDHGPLFAALLGLSVLAITNTISIGSWSFRIPLPQRMEHGLSMFRSSARLLWPTLVILTVVIAANSLRRLRYGALLVTMAFVVQLVDSNPQIRTVASAQDGRSLSIPYDRLFWMSIPQQYTIIASLPASNLGFDWSSCALAAVKTNRTAECGYFGRVQGLEAVNRERSSQVLSGKLENNVIYMVSRGWLESNRRDLDLVFDDPAVNVVAAVGVFGFGSDTVFLFPACASQVSCSFLGSYSRPFDASIVVSG